MSPPFKLSVLPLTSIASLWLRVHKQTPQNVHRHERERRPQQQVQQFHQDAGDGGGPGHQLPDLRITGEEDSDATDVPHSHGLVIVTSSSGLKIKTIWYRPLYCRCVTWRSDQNVFTIHR